MKLIALAWGVCILAVLLGLRLEACRVFLAQVWASVELLAVLVFSALAA